LRYLADKNSAHTHTDRHTPMTTRPCGLRRAGNNSRTEAKIGTQVAHVTRDSDTTFNVKGQLAGAWEYCGLLAYIVNIH